MEGLVRGFNIAHEAIQRDREFIACDRLIALEAAIGAAAHDVLTDYGFDGWGSPVFCRNI